MNKKVKKNKDNYTVVYRQHNLKQIFTEFDLKCRAMSSALTPAFFRGR